MNDESPPPPPDAPKPPAFAASPIAQVPQAQTVVEQLNSHSRTLQYVGVGLIVLAFPLTWWSLTRYRVYEQRGVDLASPEQAAAIDKDMDEDEKKEYQERIGIYARAWTLNLGRFEQTFYYPYLGEDYAGHLNNEILYSRSSGTLGLRGWTTWTGWFGIVFAVLLFVAQFAPKFSEDLEPIAWSFPLALTAVYGFFTLIALMFFFSVPGANDDGIAQGVGLGNYLAILGGLLATTGSVFEGIKSVNARHAELAAASDDEEETEAAEPDTDQPKPKPKPKSKSRNDEPPPRQKTRLEDW